MIAAIPVITNSNLPTNNSKAISGPKSKTQKPYKSSLKQTLKSLSKSGKLHDAVRLIESSPSSFSDPETYVLLLHSCITKRALHHGERLYNHLLQLSKNGDDNLLQDPTLKSKLITLFAVCGRLEVARRVFEDGLENGRVPESVWVAMAIGMCQCE
ncbi:hypothetical protein Tsubulata_010382 [Turnera subulata]|uniref:Pentacotripeptide-repeat region of PRORP domain-containing protein n=1 Tax=Turnera subulata TaxID=218843 RepID=A0A9Q0JFL7_9ROSI|nr:hypothetical protein Tsubulata_010382 [Turnera subulata]